MATLTSDDGRYALHHDPDSSEYVTIVERTDSIPVLDAASVSLPRAVLLAMLGVTVEPSNPQ